MARLDLKFERTELFPGGLAHVRVGYHTAEQPGEVLISADAASYEELEVYVRELRTELDSLLVKARRKFAAARNMPKQPLGLLMPDK